MHEQSDHEQVRDTILGHENFLALDQGERAQLAHETLSTSLSKLDELLARLHEDNVD